MWETNQHTASSSCCRSTLTIYGLCVLGAHNIKKWGVWTMYLHQLGWEPTLRSVVVPLPCKQRDCMLEPHGWSWMFLVYFLSVCHFFFPSHLHTLHQFVILHEIGSKMCRNNSSLQWALVSLYRKLMHTIRSRGGLGITVCLLVSYTCTKYVDESVASTNANACAWHPIRFLIIFQGSPIATPHSQVISAQLPSSVL
jgi:hypothetical protein